MLRGGRRTYRRPNDDAATARPHLTLLDASAVGRLHDYSLHILASTGVRVDSAEGRELLAGAPGVTP
jgi:trimethylamine:corrinoid methyltransferase-like protein